MNACTPARTAEGDASCEESIVVCVCVCVCVCAWDEETPRPCFLRSLCRFLEMRAFITWGGMSEVVTFST